VGPHSAGADPGPASYGRGGEEPTVTDANLLLGYLDASSPLAGGVELDAGAAERAVGGLGRRLGLSLEDAAAGIVRVASTELGRPDAEVRATYDLRYAGQAFELSIPGPARPNPTDLRGAFDEAHEERYGYSDPDSELELVTIRVAVAGAAAELPARLGAEA